MFHVKHVGLAGEPPGTAAGIFGDRFDAAAQYAESGFPVSERIANDWRLPNALPLEGCCTQQDPDSIRTWTVDGQPPAAGQLFRNPDLARTLRLLQTGNLQTYAFLFVLGVALVLYFVLGK